MATIMAAMAAIFKLHLSLSHSSGRILSNFELKGVGLGYRRQLYFHCLLKYMVICAFENSPSIPSFLATQIVYIRYGQFKKNDSISFYLFILVFLYLIAANKSVLLLYACAHKISLKYLFPEKIAIEICC